MNFSLKSIASAVVLAVAVSGAHAASIDTGAGGNGTLFLNVWDATGSYTFNLQQSINDFETNLATAGSIDQAYSLTNFGSFLAGVADANALKFNLVATDTSGARRLLTTYSALPAATNSNDKIRTAAANVTGFAGALNTAMAGADNVSVSSASSAFAGKAAMGNRIGGNLNFDTFGALSANSYANGLSFMRIDAAATGTALSKYVPYAEADGTSVKVYIDSANTLHIQAMPVPEPESYAMLLAGLGLVGLMARRRQNAA